MPSVSVIDDGAGGEAGTDLVAAAAGHEPQRRAVLELDAQRRAAARAATALGQQVAVRLASMTEARPASTCRRHVDRRRGVDRRLAALEQVIHHRRRRPAQRLTALADAGQD
jgi:hypothetical protein